MKNPDICLIKPANLNTISGDSPPRSAASLICYLIVAEGLVDLQLQAAWWTQTIETIPLKTYCPILKIKHFEKKKCVPLLGPEE